MTLLPKAAPRVNYLNNRDILKEIHFSKNTYCWYRDPVADHQFDLILPSVDREAPTCCACFTPSSSSEGSTAVSHPAAARPCRTIKIRVTRTANRRALDP